MRAAKHLKKSELKLVCYTNSISHITTKSSPSSVEIGVNGAQGPSLYVSAPPMGKGDDVDDWSASNIIVPFWWVGLSNKEEDCNVVLKTHRNMNVDLPCYVNDKPIKQHAVILCFREAKVKQKTPPSLDECVAAASSSSASGSSASSSQPAPPPSKKSRKP